MKSSILILVAAAALTFGAQPNLAADVQVKVPSTPEALQAADLIARAQRALLAYVSACSARDHVGVERSLTSDAVFEYTLDDAAATYIEVDAPTLIGDCWSNVPALDTGEHVQTLWIFPTGDANTVFVHYSTSAAAGAESTASSTEHLALVEMRDQRIAKLQDFTAAPPALLAREKAEPSSPRVSAAKRGA